VRDDVAKWKVLPSTPTPSPEALMYTGRIGVSDIDSFNHPLRAIHIYDDNGLAEQVWESGTVNFDDVGRIWRLGTDSSGNFEITRSKSSLRDTEVSIHLDASGRMGIHTIPDTALHVVSLSGQTAIKAEAIDNGIGIESVGGPNSGHGGTFRALANDDHGAIGYGHGTGTGIVGVGGNDSGIGIHGIGGTGNSTGVLGEGVGDGKGIHGIGGGDQAGVYGVGGDTGIGGEFFGGSTSGYGIYGDSVERGVYGKGLGAGTGGYFDGGATNGVGMIAIGGGSARGAEITGGALVGGDLDMNVVNDEVRCNSYRWHAAASRTFTIWVGHPQATFLRTHDLTTSVVSEVTDTEARWSGTSAENYVIAPFIWPNHYILTAWTAYIGVAGASSVTVQLMRKLMSSVSSQIIGTPQTSAVSAGQITLGQTGLSIGRIDTFTYFLKCFHATGAGTSHFKGLELVFSCSEPPIEGWSL
ncbi:hypothetical protein KAR91_70895, partial [Candidatus Pacearchaeota archaeon]|nr:hypothetical protein [Candidatus Pacearchaeota archaeon]